MPTTPTYVFCLKEGTGSYEQKQSNTNANFTADGLNANTGYTIKVDVKDVAGNTGSTELSIKTYAMPSDSEVKQGAIIFSEPTWSNEKASITMSTSADYKAYTIQYQVNGTNGNWTTGTTAENLVDGDVLYARLTDGTNATGYTTITIKNTDSTVYNYTATDMVEYDAGNWTEAEINSLKSLKLYNINVEKTASATSGLNFTFGEFTYKGDTANESNISNGTIIVNRNKSVEPQNSWSQSSFNTSSPMSDGWIVLEWGETSGTKKYVKKLVHAGAPENFVYYGSNTNDAYRAEYILSGGTRQTGYATYKPRSFDMYKDTSKTDMIEEVHCMTYDEAKTVMGSSNITNDIRVNIDSIYWLASTSGYYNGVFMNTDDDLWNVYVDSIQFGGNYFCLGIRPVVTLKSGVYVDTSKHSGTGSDKYVLEMD